MRKINILDCTLRDGGYCNEWNFGKSNIKNVISKLEDSNIEIIECGFVSNKVDNDENSSKFCSFESINNVVPNLKKCKYVCMVNFGEYELLNIPKRSEKGIDGIRVAFHKKDLEKATSFCAGLKQKGYDVFIQAMLSENYSADEFVDLIKKVNEFNPYAFYVVDSFGSMYPKDVEKYFEIANKNLNGNIKIGFHAHNNLEMAFSNAQNFVNFETNHDLIVDSSIFGMGRGAGNLCTELITRYLNETMDGKYNLVPILEAIDNYIYPIALQLPWGYNAHYYMSAIHHCHPSYASYLMNMQTLTMSDVNSLLESIPDDKKTSFDKNFIECLYLNYQNDKANKSIKIADLNESINQDIALIIAPGSSIKKYKDDILNSISRVKPVVFSVNFYPEGFPINYIFVSNRKKMLELENYGNTNIIATSNLPELNKNCICVDYESLCDKEFVQPDNAGMMLLRLLNKINISKVLLAGFDGYKSSSETFFDSKIKRHKKIDFSDEKTADIKSQIEKLSKELEIEFLTPSLYDELNNKKYE